MNRRAMSKPQVQHAWLGDEQGEQRRVGHIYCFLLPEKIGQTGKCNRRRRPPIIGQYVGLVAAKKQAADEEGRLLKIRIEKEFLEDITSTKKLCTAQEGKKSPQHREDRLGRYHSPTDPRRECIAKVVTKFQNLKGSFIRTLKSSAQAIATAVGDFTSRTRLEETEILKTENNRLITKLNGMRRKISDLKELVERLERTGDSPQNLPRSAFPHYHQGKGSPDRDAGGFPPSKSRTARKAKPKPGSPSLPSGSQPRSVVRSRGVLTRMPSSAGSSSRLG